MIQTPTRSHCSTCSMADETQTQNRHPRYLQVEGTPESRWKQADKERQLLGDTCPSDILANGPSASYYSNHSRLAYPSTLILYLLFHKPQWRSTITTCKFLKGFMSQVLCQTMTTYWKSRRIFMDRSKPDRYGTSIWCPSWHLRQSDSLKAPSSTVNECVFYKGQEHLRTLDSTPTILSCQDPTSLC